MSFLVLHMDKFKKEAIRGIQSHNRRERESRSNPDIDYGRSSGNYELYEEAVGNYAQAVQSRIDDLLLVKAVRKDAVHLCGLIVSSDKAFFDRLTPEESRRFFEESKAFLTDFVGRENVVSAMVHMDEKTPHMHFLHVPVTPDGRLNANSIYTRSSLKKLQTDLPRYLKSKGFDIQRGVEQKPGSAKRHLDTREFKQQQEAVASLRAEEKAITERLAAARQEELSLEDLLQEYQRQAQEAEKSLSQFRGIPVATIFNYKVAMQEAFSVIQQLRTALSDKHILETQIRHMERDKARLATRVAELTQELSRLESTHTKHKLETTKLLTHFQENTQAMRAELEDLRKLVTHPRVQPLYMVFKQEQEEKRRREAEEQKQQEQKRQKEQARQQQAEQERQRQLEVEAQSQRRSMWMR